MAKLPPGPWVIVEPHGPNECSAIEDARGEFVLAPSFGITLIAASPEVLRSVAALPALIALAKDLAAPTCRCNCGMYTGKHKCLTCRARAALPADGEGISAQ